MLGISKGEKVIVLDFSEKSCLGITFSNGHAFMEFSPHKAKIPGCALVHIKSLL